MCDLMVVFLKNQTINVNQINEVFGGSPAMLSTSDIGVKDNRKGPIKLT